MNKKTEDAYLFESQVEVSQHMLSAIKLVTTFNNKILNVIESEGIDAVDESMLQAFLGKKQGIFYAIEKSIKLLEKIISISNKLNIKVFKPSDELTDADIKDIKILKQVILTSDKFRAGIKQEDIEMYTSVFEDYDTNMETIQVEIDSKGEQYDLDFELQQPFKERISKEQEKMIERFDIYRAKLDAESPYYLTEEEADRLYSG